MEGSCAWKGVTHERELHMYGEKVYLKGKHRLRRVSHVFPGKNFRVAA